MNANAVVDYLGPADVAMPQLAQAIALWGSAAVLLLCIVLAARMARKYRSALPLLFLLAGFCTLPLEPIGTLLGHAVHPEAGQWVLFKSNSRAIPVHLGLIYCFFFGAFYMAMYSRIVSRSFTVAYVWKTYIACCVIAFFGEILPVSSGLWVYYDHQALWIWKHTMPLFWTMVNPVCVLVPMTLIAYFHPQLSGWRQWLVLPISPIGAFAGFIGAGFPYLTAVGANADARLIELSGVASLAMAALMTAGCAVVLTQLPSPLSGVRNH